MLEILEFVSDSRILYLVTVVLKNPDFLRIPFFEMEPDDFMTENQFSADDYFYCDMFLFWFFFSQEIPPFFQIIILKTLPLKSAWDVELTVLTVLTIDTTARWCRSGLPV